MRGLRSWSGVVLFAYLTTHFVNHALGLVSLEAMEAGRQWFLALWRNPVGTLALYGALTTHLALVLWALYERRTLRVPGWRAGQILLGLAIPPLLAEHIIGTRLLHELYGIGDAYTYVVLVLWEFAPEKGAQQALTLLVAWLHGCIGLHFWLRVKPWYPRLVPFVYAGALLLPTLALLGFAEAGLEVAVLARDPAWIEGVVTGLPFPDEAAVATAITVRNATYGIFAALIGTVIAARLVRAGRERRRASIGGRLRR